MTINKSIIVKIGGKILENRDNIESTLSQFKLLLNDNILQKIIIVPGGGLRADFIRSMDDKLNIGDDLAHWMAIYAMNHNGGELCRDYNEVNCIDNYETLQIFLKNESEKGISVFLPYDYLVQEDQLPHSWKVTSDSITLYLADKLELKECYFIKDVDGIFISENGQERVIMEITTSDYIKFKNNNVMETMNKYPSKLKKTQPIDSYLLSLIDKSRISCIILNGAVSKSRILEFFSDTNKQNRIYTKIY